MSGTKSILPDFLHQPDVTAAIEKGANAFDNRPPFLEWCDENKQDHIDTWETLKAKGAQDIPGVTLETMQAMLYVTRYEIDVNTLRETGEFIEILENS